MNTMMVRVLDPRRVELVRQVFGTDVVPVVPEPFNARMTERGIDQVYLLDGARLTPEQRAKLIAVYGQRFGMTELEAEAEYAEGGMPVLVKGTEIVCP